MLRSTVGRKWIATVLPATALDDDGRSVTDCYTANGSACAMPLDNDNTYQDCASATAIKSNQSNGLAGVFAKESEETSSSNQLTRPFDEDDADGDNYVECSEYDRSDLACYLEGRYRSLVARTAMTKTRLCSQQRQNIAMVAPTTVAMLPMQQMGLLKMSPISMAMVCRVQSDKWSALGGCNYGPNHDTALY